MKNKGHHSHGRRQQFTIFSCGCLCLFYVGDMTTILTTILTTTPTAITLYAIAQEIQKPLKIKGSEG